MLERIRCLEASEVEARVGQVPDSGKGVSLLLYKDARCDMAILDEVAGPMNWQRSHEFKDGKLYCAVSLWDDEKSAWVSKEDVGSASNMEADKGQASDAFKRACFNWGIGRELYTAPFIWVPSELCELRKGRNGKLTCYDRFEVAVFKCSGHVIDELQVQRDDGTLVFDWTRKGGSRRIARPQAAASACGQGRQAPKQAKPGFMQLMGECADRFYGGDKAALADSLKATLGMGPDDQFNGDPKALAEAEQLMQLMLKAGTAEVALA